MTLAIAFDMDGVLIDSQPLHYEIDIAVLKACGYPANLETVTPYTGVSNPDRWPKYKQTLSLSQSVERLISLQNQFQTNIFTTASLSPIDGIPELLKYLNSLNIPCAVASSSSQELISLVLSRCELGQYFTHIVSGEDVQAGKPAPDIYLKAAKVLGRPPENCIAIEDSPIGILSAKNAGFTCIGYKNPTTHGQDFTHADHVVSHYSQCHEIISRLSAPKREVQP
ncbi:MAG: HAD family hydrolase [Defluviitaleaceae bacterium]|nr:HAD family hydrolase [Defluviitaleaceae bacterium]